MTKPSAFFLVPEWGQQRTASLHEYLSQNYAMDVAGFDLPEHSRAPAARALRNARRLLRKRPPLFDRYSGCEAQIQRQLRRHYDIAIVEHFWCASYAPILRPHADLLILDLHNIESQLARTHAHATHGAESFAFSRFARAYQQLEEQYLRQFDILLVTSEADRARVAHPRVVVYPNALPDLAKPEASEANYIVFSGNLEYHPNIEAVRWFSQNIWPRIRTEFPALEWWLVGRNPQAVEKIVRGDSRIRLTGAVDDALPLIARAQAAIVPLLSGSGTRFKILEAWAAERAVVSTPLGAEGLGAIHQQHLWVADGVSDFTESLRFVLNNTEVRCNLGRNGRALYRNDFTWPVAWRALAAAGI